MSFTFVLLVFICVTGLAFSSPMTFAGIMVMGNLIELRNDSHPVDFQRLGSIWVALAVTMVAVKKPMEEYMLKFFERKMDLTNSEEAKFLTRQEKAHQSFRTELNYVEIFMLVVGTLQWGYGDLFACWAKGKGFTVCY